MIETSLTPVTARRSGLVLWLIWVAATCAGIPIFGVLAPALLSMQGGGIDIGYAWIVLILIGLCWLGLVLCGAIQHFALRAFVPGRARWLGNTLIGALIGLPLGFVLLAIGARISWGMAWLMIGWLIPIIVCQRQVLQRYSRRANWWLLAGPLGWSAGVIVAWELVKLLWKGPVLSDLAAAIVSALAMGLLVGGITGVALLHILRREALAVALPTEASTAPASESSPVPGVRGSGEVTGAGL